MRNRDAILACPHCGQSFLSSLAQVETEVTCAECRGRIRLPSSTEMRSLSIQQEETETRKSKEARLVTVITVIALGAGTALLIVILFVRPQRPPAVPPPDVPAAADMTASTEDAHPPDYDWQSPPRKRPSDGSQDVFDLVESGRNNELRKLLERNPGAASSEIKGTPVLFNAVLSNNEEAVRLLIEHGADVNAVARMGGLTALHHAADQGNNAICKLLLNAGADIDSTAGGCTPLLHAVMAKRQLTIGYLLDRGADPEAGKPGMRPIDYANDEDARELLEYHLHVRAKLRARKNATQSPQASDLYERRREDPLGQATREWEARERRSRESGRRDQFIRELAGLVDRETTILMYREDAVSRFELLKSEADLAEMRRDGRGYQAARRQMQKVFDEMQGYTSQFQAVSAQRLRYLRADPDVYKATLITMSGDPSVHEATRARARQILGQLRH